MFRPQAPYPSSFLVFLSLLSSCNGQITYRRRTRSPARVIAGAVIGGVALLFFILAFMFWSRRRRRAMTFQAASIPRPHVGEQPYYGPPQQPYGVGGTMYTPNQAPPTQQYFPPPGPPPSQQYKPPQGPPPSQPHGEKPMNEEAPPPPYPPPVHVSTGDVQPFVGGFRP